MILPCGTKRESLGKHNLSQLLPLTSKVDYYGIKVILQVLFYNPSIYGEVKSSDKHYFDQIWTLTSKKKYDFTFWGIKLIFVLSQKGLHVYQGNVKICQPSTRLTAVTGQIRTQGCTYWRTHAQTSN